MIVYVETNFLLEAAYLQERHESCTSKKGFANPAIESELLSHGCKVLVNFGDAAAYIQTVLRSAR